MSAQYRDNTNKSYLRSSYSNAASRQNCVSCPSSCSCDLGTRSAMDRLMIQAWQEGPVGHPDVFNHLSGPHTTQVLLTTPLLSSASGYKNESDAQKCAFNNDCPDTDCSSTDGSCFCIYTCDGAKYYWDCSMNPQHPQCPP